MPESKPPSGGATPLKAQLKTCDLDVALGRMGGNRTLLGQMAQFLFDSAPELLQRLRVAAEHQNAEELLRAAHSLKGLVVNFNAEAVAETLQRIEEAARAGALADAEEGVRDVDQRLLELTEDVRAGLAQI